MKSTKPLASEDLLAVFLGGLWLAGCLLSVVVSAGYEPAIQQWLAAPGGWTASPLEGLADVWPGVIGVGLQLLVAFTAVVGFRRPGRFAAGFAAVLGLALLSMLVAKQSFVAYCGLAYPLWAIGLGLLVANTVGTPAALKPAVRAELYMKVGLVLLGAEVLFGKLLALGLPGVCVAWVVTPIVLCTTFWFGQRVLRIESSSLNMVVSADMSVCGVSAAIATAAACRAKKEELSLAIGMSMMFTVAMMLVQPLVVRALGLGQVVGGAWIGGTIDSTGAVAAAGELLGDQALAVASTIKMIQNVLIGVVAFSVAAYWVGRYGEDAAGPRSSAREVWRRFPKFILGFVAVSIIFSLIHGSALAGEQIVTSTTNLTKTLRTWCFCLAFVSIGLETNFRELAGVVREGKPLLLYVYADRRST